MKKSTPRPARRCIRCNILTTTKLCSACKRIAQSILEHRRAQ